MKKQHWILLVISLVLGGLLSYFASSHPDGLERVAEDIGFIEKAQDPTIEVIPDYQFPIEGSPFWSNFLAGVIGTLLIWIIVWGIGLLYRKKTH